MSQVSISLFIDRNITLRIDAGFKQPFMNKEMKFPLYLIVEKSLKVVQAATLLLAAASVDARASSLLLIAASRAWWKKFKTNNCQGELLAINSPCKHLHELERPPRAP
jgi:hypothetical protein